MTDNSARLDHVVLWVRDPVASADFYEKSVGLEPVRVAEYAEGKAPFPSVRLNGDHFRPHGPPMAAYMNMIPGAADSAGHPVNHVCLSPGGRFRRAAHTSGGTVRSLSGFSYDSFGARGMAKRSFYFQDPDGNVFEARHYD